MFCCLIEEKIEPEDSIVQGMTMGIIDTKDLRAAGSLLEISDVVFGKLLAQVEADYVKLGDIVRGDLLTFPDRFHLEICRDRFPVQLYHEDEGPLYARDLSEVRRANLVG